MARLLYRLGAGSARRPFVVIGTWLAILIVAGAGMATLAKPLSSEFKLPGSDFAQVLDHVGEQIPEVAGGGGTVVFHTTDGAPFSSAQRQAIKQTITSFESVDQVTGTADPFTLQAQLDSADTKLTAAKNKLDDAQERYDDGAHQYRQLTWWVQRGQRDIARIETANPADPTLPQRLRGQREAESMLRDARQRLQSAQDRLDSGWADYHTAAELAGRGAGVEFVNPAGNVALGQVRFDAQTQAIAPEILERIPELGQALDGTGVEVDYGQDISHVVEPGGAGEVIGLISAAVVLLVMLGSLLLAGLPLTIAFAGVGVALMAALSATHVFTLHQMAPILGAMLGLAVGIDYALFIVNRHRRQLAGLPGVPRRRPTREEINHAAGMSVGTAGNAVVVAGATVVIALVALCVSGIPVLVQMGLLAAATVAVTVLVALTLTPALLGLVGARAVPKAPRRPRARGGWPDRWVGRVTARPWLNVLGVVALLGILAIPAASLRLGLPDGGSEDPDSTAYRAYSLVQQNFGAGSNGPILVSADWSRPVAQADQISAELTVSRAVDSVAGVRAVLPIGFSADGRTAAFQVVPDGGPASAVTNDVVDALRGDVTDALARDGVEMGVTGATVANIEVSQTLAAALPLYLVLVIGLSLLLLTVVFRSIVVPLLATAGFLLSVGASFGIVVAVYQWGWLGWLFGVHDPGAVMSFMPTLLIGILFGLAMDYQMFLVSGMREAFVHGESARDSVRQGFSSGAKVVTAAALIMVAVFAGFISSGMVMVRPIALGLAAGVLIDAFLIRMTLIPATMQLLGERAWWIPVWLDRILPNLDVEGSALHNAAPVPAPEREPELV